MNEISSSSLYRIMKKAGAKRISDEAVNELRMTIENIAFKISSNAIDLANHAKRKTVKAEDIKLASKSLSFD